MELAAAGGGRTVRTVGGTGNERTGHQVCFLAGYVVLSNEMNDLSCGLSCDGVFFSIIYPLLRK